MPEYDKFCAACATPLELRQQDGQDRPVCPECGKVVYFDPKLATASIIERDGHTLMVRRAVQVGYGLWSMPGGYVDRGEVVEHAAAREVREETGLIVEVQRLIGVFSDAGNPVVVAAYSAAETGGELVPGPECLELGFYPPDQLPPLAFPRDAEIIRRWESMRNPGAEIA
jgi:ADP-ribose pyrophosphatase YjhB (NUDIX family)